MESAMMKRFVLLCCSALALVAPELRGDELTDLFDGWPVPQPRPRPPEAPTPDDQRVVVNDDGGGLIHEYVTRWTTIASQGAEVEVRGKCVSACTLVTAYVSKEKLCFGKNSSLSFHVARKNSSDFNPSPEMTQWMIDQYPADIRGWIAAHGGSEKMPWSGLLMMHAYELWNMGYRKCKT
jgi:hypothetical protein